MQLHQPVLIQHTETRRIDGDQKSHISVVGSVSFREDNTYINLVCFFFFFLQNVYFKSKFYFNKDKKDVLAYSFSVLYSLPGETVTWVSCRRLVGREQEPLIHPGSSIFGQG